MASGYVGEAKVHVVVETLPTHGLVSRMAKAWPPENSGNEQAKTPSRNKPPIPVKSKLVQRRVSVSVSLELARYSERIVWCTVC